MLRINQGKTSDSSTPILWALVVDKTSGFLVDPESMSFRILDISTTDNRITPVEVVATTAIDLDDAPAGDRLGVGRYALTWVVPGAQNTGDHLMEVTYTYIALNGDSHTETWSHEFQVVPDDEPLLLNSYISISDIRAEGISATVLPNARALSRIALAQKLVNQFTGRFFYPQFVDAALNGKRASAMLLAHPIIALEAVRTNLGYWNPYESVVEPDAVRVYNRHLTQNLLHPDDRDNPKVEFWSDQVLSVFYPGYFQEGYKFSRGTQNVELPGYYGYTDPDGSPFGVTPEPIRLATMLILKSYIATAGSSTFGPSPPVIGEKTRDQSVTYANPWDADSSQASGFTGNPEIDSILALYRRPMHIGVV